MALPIEMVHGSGVTTLEDSNEWRYGEQSGGVVSVTIVPELFNPDDETLRNKYLTGLGPEATTIYIRSGVPLARITSGDNQGAYGPYDPAAQDGRQTAVAGLLESMVAVNITYAGWDVDDVYVGMRYRGDIVRSNLPVVPAEDATWLGDFYDVEDDIVTPLSAKTASTETPTVANGSLTPAKLAGYDGNTGHGKVPQVKSDGTGFDFVDIPGAVTWLNLTSKPNAAAAIPDPATDADVMAKQKRILAALRSWGIISSK